MSLGINLIIGPGGGGVGGGGGVVPSMSLDFVNNIYLLNGTLYGTLPTLLAAGGGSFSRSSAGYDLLGSQSFSTDTPRITTVGLLLESAATNLVIQSKLASGWGSETTDTLTVNNAVAPDGTTTAATIKEDASASTHGLFRNQTSNALSAIRYVHSQYSKNTAGTRNVFLEMFNSGFSEHALVIINPADGTVAQSSSVTANWGAGVASSYAAAQSYRRCAQSFVAAVDAGFRVFGRLASGSTQSYTGDNTSTQATWGVQLEAAAANGYFKDNPSSLIATGAAAGTRSADVFSLNVPSGKSTATITFSDNSTKQVSVTGGGSWDVAAAVASHVAANVVAPVLKSITFA